MSGRFFAFADRAAAEASCPEIFDTDEFDNSVLKPGFDAIGGGWLVPPVYGAPDPETGEPGALEQEGEWGGNFWVLTSRSVPSSMESFEVLETYEARIAAGKQGYA